MGEIRLADYVMQYLEKLKVNHIFMLSGGGIMYLVDALGRSKIDYICCHHEQAAGIAAQAYAMEKNSLGVCMVTTGPGGTNMLTALGASYVDSTPVLFLTGQVKTTDFASLRKVRQYGAQENDIISMAKPVSKYAVTVLDAQKIRYHLEKAVYFALHGRQGPVCLDIPLDIQNTKIDPEKLMGFNELEIDEHDICAEIQPNSESIEKVVDSTIELLKTSKRPLFLIGHGLNASGAQQCFIELQKKLNIPVVSTWRALNVMDYEDDLYFGSPGLQACRYSNLITQGADLLIVLGSRLDNMITAFNEEHFAFRAKKIIVDIDENEIQKLNMSDVTSAVCDVKFFLEILCNKLNKQVFPSYFTWQKFCLQMKLTYPLENEKQDVQLEGVDLYQLTMRLSEQCNKNDVIVVSSTSRCNTAGHMAFKHKAEQKTISSMGFGSMGFALPSAIGAWYASGKKRVIMIEGDGSLQLNIQELQTVVHHHINAKLFVFHNMGYAAIATMQNRNFNGFHVGCDVDSGVSMPNLEKIADAYQINYFAIKSNEESDYVIKKVLNCEGPVICEFFGHIAYDEIPKCISYLDQRGNRVSALLENPYPFLTEDELRYIYNPLLGGEKIE